MTDLDRWYRAEYCLDFHGHRIFAREDGDGAETLLLIHGFPTSSWDRHLLWPELRHRYRLLTLDLLGFGHSAKPAGHRYRIAEQADLCEQLLAQTGTRGCHLLAHDYGNTVAQELLARYNEGDSLLRLHSVTFLNGGLFPEAHRPIRLQTLLQGPLGPLLARLVSKRGFAANLRRIFGPKTPPQAEHIDGFWQLLRRDNGHHRLPALLHYLHERRAERERWVGALLRNRVPIGFINGSLDPISGVHMADRWRELIGDRTLIELPQIGHYPQVEDPKGVLNAFDELQRRYAAAPPPPDRRASGAR